MVERLTADEITEKLGDLETWEQSQGEISRQFTFADFPAAMKFVNAVALAAEQANHHPDMDIRWNKVLLRLSTHSKGGLTDLDFALAKTINTLA